MEVSLVAVAGWSTGDLAESFSEVSGGGWSCLSGRSLAVVAQCSIFTDFEETEGPVVFINVSVISVRCIHYLPKTVNYIKPSILLFFFLCRKGAQPTATKIS